MKFLLGKNMQANNTAIFIPIAFSAFYYLPRSKYLQVKIAEEN